MVGHVASGEVGFLFIFKMGEALRCLNTDKKGPIGKERRRKEVINMVGVGFPGGAVVENLPANAGDTGLSPGLGRSHMPRSSWAREPQ